MEGKRDEANMQKNRYHVLRSPRFLLKIVFFGVIISTKPITI